MSTELDLVSQIISKDIDKSRITNVNMNKLHALFPKLDADTLARYLIARNNKIHKATQLLTIAENWRSNHWPILKADCINEINKGKVYVRGTDKEGRPLLIFRSRLHDPKNRSPEEMAKMIMWWAEQAIKECPSDKSKYTVLIDRSDAGGADFEFVKFFAKLFQDAYPERLHRVVVFPSGMVFWSIWNVVKWFMDPVTRNKVSPCVYFYGVQEFISDENIPVCMGGKCTYEFNSCDFEDPYPEELVMKTLEEREGKAPAPEGSFFKPEEGSVTPTPGEEEEDDEGDETA